MNNQSGGAVQPHQMGRKGWGGRGGQGEKGLDGRISKQPRFYIIKLRENLGGSKNSPNFYV